MTPGDLALAFRALGALVVVLGAVLLVARMARRHTGRGGESGLRVVQRIALSRDASIAIVEVGGQALVVGVTAHGISMLSSTEKGSLDGELLRTALIAGHDMARAQMDADTADPRALAADSQAFDTISKETATMTSTDDSHSDLRPDEPLVEGGYARRTVLARPSVRSTLPPGGGLEAYPDLASALRAAGMTTTGTVMPALQIDESQLRGRKGVQHSPAGLAAEKIKAATMAWVASLPRAQYVSSPAATDGPPVDFARALEAERASIVEDVEPHVAQVAPVRAVPRSPVVARGPVVAPAPAVAPVPAVAHATAVAPVAVVAAEDDAEQDAAQPDAAQPEAAQPDPAQPEASDATVARADSDDAASESDTQAVPEPTQNTDVVADATAEPAAATEATVTTPAGDTTPATDTETEIESTMSDDEQIVAAQARAAARALGAVRALHAEAAAAEQRAEAELAAGATQAMQARLALQALDGTTFSSTPLSGRAERLGGQSERRRARRRGSAEIVLPPSAMPAMPSTPAGPAMPPFSVDLREPVTNAFGQLLDPVRQEPTGVDPDLLHVEGPNPEALIVSRLAQVAAEHSAAERDHAEQLEQLRERLESQRITVEAAATLQARLEANVLEQMTLMQTQAERQRQTEEALRAEYDRLETERISQEAAEAARHRLAMGVLEQMKVMQARLDAQRAAEDAERAAREELVAEAARVERLKKEAEVMEQMRVMQERLEAQRAIDEADRLRTEAENLRVEAEILAQMQEIQERIEGTRSEVDTFASELSTPDTEAVTDEALAIEAMAVEALAVETMDDHATAAEPVLEQGDLDETVLDETDDTLDQDDDADISFDAHLTGAPRPARRRLGGLLELAGRRS